MSTVDKLTAFTGFGDSVLIPAVRRPLVQVGLVEDRGHCRQLIRNAAPATPGVYGWVDRNQRLLYVGKSKSLRHRLLSYFGKTQSDPKIDRMRQFSSRLVWEPISHELLALIREQELIFRWRPSFNRLGQPERRKPGFLCIGGGAAPCAFMASEATSSAEICIGPIVGLGDLRLAIESLNYVFGLRDCSDRTRMSLSNQLPLFNDLKHAQCIRFELDSCLGPCTGGCSSGKYRQAVQRAIAFLRGDDDSILANLKMEIEKAVARLAFERAAVVSQQLASLSWLARRLQQRRRQRHELTGQLPIPTFDHKPCQLNLDEGYVAGFTHRVSNRSSVTKPKRLEQNDGSLAVEWMLIVAGWFQKNADQKALLQRSTASSVAERATA